MKSILQNTAIILAIFLVIMSGGGCGDDTNEETVDGAVENGSTSGDPATGTSAADQLIDELCNAVARCDSSLTKSGCVSAMNGNTGRQIWDDFGLEDEENELTASQVRSGISNGSITVNEIALEDCLHELIEACDSEGESAPIGNYNNVENFVLEDGSCPLVLQSS